jgi:ATP-dependent helicase HrpB
MASRIEPDWLLDAFPDDLQERGELSFNAGSGRVDSRSTLFYADLPVLESRRPARGGEAGVAAVLFRAALDGAPAGGDMEPFLDRVRFLGACRPDLGLPGREDMGRAVLEAACEGCASLRDLATADWRQARIRALGAAGAGLLETWAPETVLLGRRKVKVHYEGEAPWIEARLQDFIGIKAGPRIAGGSVPVVLHILAPNNRDLQVTTDLAGFWSRTYPGLRQALSRRYPRHVWPD